MYASYLLSDLSCHQKNLFTKSHDFLPVHNYRIDIVLSFFVYQSDVSLIQKLHRQKEELFLNIFIKKSLKNDLCLDL
jgi:hypothetical protein